MGMALAMYRVMSMQIKSKYKSMYFSAALAVFLNWCDRAARIHVYVCCSAALCDLCRHPGAAFAMADIYHCVHSFGNIELLTRTPLAIKAGLGWRFNQFCFNGHHFGVVTYFLANFFN